MRLTKPLAVLVLAAAAGLAWTWLRPQPAPAAAPPQGTLSFRVVFGQRQERTADYSGSVSLDEGRVAGLTPWHFFGGDVVQGDSWKLLLKRAGFKDQPDQPMPLSRPAPSPVVVPAGLVVTVEAPPSATAFIRTAQGNFEVRLRDLQYGRTLHFHNGDTAVERTPSPQRISPPAAGPRPEEHDYPSLLVTRQGVVWIAWQAYRDQGEQVYVRHSQPSGWSQVVALTERKGDIHQTAIAEDADGRVWVVWSERSGEDWDLYARSFDGVRWSPREKLTGAGHPNLFPRLVAGPAGALHLIWIGHRAGASHVFWSRRAGNKWSEPQELSGASAWAPEAALDSSGNLFVVWDSYRNGNYDIFLRRAGADGSLGPEQQITQSARFQAHASVAVDKQDRVWVAWDEAGFNWGKGWSLEDQWRATVLYQDRRPRVAVLDKGTWKQPAADLMAVVPPKYRRYVHAPRLACDAQGRLWLALQIPTSANAFVQFWANNPRWEHFLTSLEGGRWSPLMPIPQTSSRLDGTFRIEAGGRGIWMAWVNDNRTVGFSSGGARPPATHEIDAAPFSVESAAAGPELEAFADAADTAPPVHPAENEDVARLRAYRETVGGATYRIVRGDFHRHTEVSNDGVADGSLEDFFRYMLDAAQFDTGIISDHVASLDEYGWWRTEKASDLFHIPDRFTPLFGYERSVAYPNGHRNVVFAQRGVPLLPVSPGEGRGKINSGPILYPYLKQNRGICMLHSLATDQGSDYRDNDPVVEPLVEIYQGFHASYEYEGAPRAETRAFNVAMHGRFQPAGFYWNALAKGYRLGVQSSSDHLSTHTSYTMVYTPSTARADIVESMRQRHAYGATDNILVSFQATDSAGRTHLMGDAFESSSAPRFRVKVAGSAPIAKVEIVKDGRFVFETQPSGAEADFTFVDNNSVPGQSYYYVRVIQTDRNLAWSSPVWVTRR